MQKKRKGKQKVRVEIVLNKPRRHNTEAIRLFPFSRTLDVRLESFKNFYRVRRISRW